LSRLGRTFTAAGALVVLALPVLGLVRLADAADTTASRGDVPSTAPVASTSSVLPHVVTPLLSVRRIPGLVAGKPPTDALVKSLGALASDVGDTSCLTVSAGGSEVYERHGDTAIVPGSNLKLLVAAVAVERLGLDARFTTALVAADQVRDGAVNGDLFLVGGGDPVLSTVPFLAAAQHLFRYVPMPATSFEGLVQALADAGVTKVNGRIVADDSRYDAERSVPSWPAAYRTEFQVAPLSALLVDDGFRSTSPLRQADDPALQAATVLTSLLESRGISVGGTPARGTAPAGGLEVASVSSAPLSELMPELLRESDNTTAELLLKEIAVDAGVVPGTRAAGIAEVRKQLDAWSIPTTGLAMVDGSGLDRGNRVTCRTLSRLLSRFSVDSELVQALAVAGRSGTLASQFKGNPMEGRLSAKTGTLTGVKALTGVVPEDEGPPLTFSLVLNAPNASSAATRVWDRLGRALAQYPSKVDLTPYGPVPPVTGSS